MDHISVQMPCGATSNNLTRREDDMSEWLQLIRGEFSEMPGLQLTKPQVKRLWNLDTDTCDAVLEVLEQSQFLRRTRTGAYMKSGQ